ncbi:hypothetical protein ACHAWC_006781 [Mediolabrus comicus]
MMMMWKAMFMIVMMASLPIINTTAYTATPSSSLLSKRRWSPPATATMQQYDAIIKHSRSEKSFVLFSEPSQSNDYEEEYNDDDDEDYEDYEDEEEMMMPPIINGFEDNDDEIMDIFTLDELQSMTVTQLKQQLRLRGMKVGGNKSDLIQRLLEKRGGGSNSGSTVAAADANVDGYSKYQKPYTKKTQKSTASTSTSTSPTATESDRVKEAKARGAEIVDVTEFIDEREWDRSFRSSDDHRSISRSSTIDVESKEDMNNNKEQDDTSSSSTTTSSNTEVWGEDARIVDDYEGRSIVVDGLSRTVIEYTGSNNTIVQAYVVGSRDSLKKFLRGGTSTSATSTDNDDDSKDKGKKKKKKTEYSSMEEENPNIRPDEVEGIEDNSDPGTYYQNIERDYGDWGVYTPTGAQLSSAEVQGVLLLSDVYGPFTDNTQALADKIAFECQPVVVLVPDLFRGDPWTMNPTVDETSTTSLVERNEKGKSYEEWRASHPERRVDVDIRAAAAVLRERYAVSSIAVWGTCYGGGRALEAAAGWYAGGPSSYYEDAFSDRRAPPHVDPIACISWYPTRYDANKLFGKNHDGFRTFESGEDRKVAVMAVFAEDDDLPGATQDDAALLRSCLENDPRVVDFMVKVFPGQKHGFAHSHLGQYEEGSNDLTDRFVDEAFGSMDPPLSTTGGDAEVACLLSTAWMETYTRVFLPTVGTPVRDEEDSIWSSTLEMSGSQAPQREIRKEIEEAIANFEDVQVDLGRMSQSRSPLLDGEGNEAYDRIEDERERIKQEILSKYGISPDDDDETFEKKFEKARADGALDKLLIDAYVDKDAYW